MICAGASAVSESQLVLYAELRGLVVFYFPGTTIRSGLRHTIGYVTVIPSMLGTHRSRSLDKLPYIIIGGVRARDSVGFPSYEVPVGER